MSMMDPYNRMMARNWIVECKQAISEGDNDRAYEILDSLRAVFCAAKGDVHDEGPRAA